MWIVGWKADLTSDIKFRSKSRTKHKKINIILKRTSVRSYKGRVVEKEKVEKLLRAGMAAPTAVKTHKITK